MPVSLAYHTADVFTNRAFGGNPLAVVIDEHGLTADVMQRIAAEFNYSETIFLAPPADTANTARARIFTPGHEIPFAGHPNIGAAFIAGRMGALFGKEIGGIVTFEEDAGLVEVELRRDQDGVSGARLTAPQPLAIGTEIGAELIADCARLTVADVGPGAVVASVGLGFVFAELASDQALLAARIGHDAFARHMPVGGTISLTLYRRDADRLHVRMFSPLAGVGEDPATGSAGAALAGLLAARDPSPDGLFEFTIAQGAEMGRPSQLYADVGKENGTVVRVRIGGSCVAMMRGDIFL